MKEKTLISIKGKNTTHEKKQEYDPETETNKQKILPIEIGIDIEDVVQLIGRSLKQGYLKV